MVRGDRHSVTYSMQPPTLLERRWLRRTKQSIPYSTSGSEFGTHLIRLIPYRFRALHHFYATMRGFFWIPCVLCGLPFGGHESGGSIPDPTKSADCYVMICSKCGRDGKGVRD